MLNERQKFTDRSLKFYTRRFVLEGEESAERGPKVPLQDKNEIYGLWRCDNIGCSNLLLIASITVGWNKISVEIVKSYRSFCWIWGSCCAIWLLAISTWGQGNNTSKNSIATFHIDELLLHFFHEYVQLHSTFYESFQTPMAIKLIE